MRKLFWEVITCYIVTTDKKRIRAGVQSRKLRYVDKEKTESHSETVKSWAQARNLINCSRNETLLKHKSFITVRTHNPPIKIYEDEYSEHVYETDYYECGAEWTFSELMEHLPIEDFIAFCKDKGLNVCPIERK